MPDSPDMLGPAPPLRCALVCVGTHLLFVLRSLLPLPPPPHPTHTYTQPWPPPIPMPLCTRTVCSSLHTLTGALLASASTTSTWIKVPSPCATRSLAPGFLSSSSPGYRVACVFERKPCRVRVFLLPPHSLTHSLSPAAHPMVAFVQCVGGASWRSGHPRDGADAVLVPPAHH